MQVAPLGSVSVKGLTELVEACELVGTLAIRKRLEAAVARGLTGSVAREAGDLIQQAIDVAPESAETCYA